MSEAVATLLLVKRAKVNSLDERGWMAIHWSAMSGHENMIKLLDKDALVAL